VRCVVFMFLALCLTASVVHALTAEELLAELPAKDSAHAAQLYEPLAAGDEAVITALCDSLVLWQEGADPKVPMALHGLANHVMRPENAVNRSKVARLYEAALNRVEDLNLKRFFMSLLRTCGDADSIDVLAPYLSNVDLFDDAIFTLEAIGGESAISAVRRAKYHGMPDSFLVSVKTALIRMTDTTIYRKDTSGLDALVLVAASTPPEEKKKKRVALLCRKALENEKLQPNIHALALRALINAIGVEALPDLLQAGESSAPTLWGMSLQLSESMPDVEITQAWIRRLDDLPEPVRPQVIYMLGGREDNSAKAAIRRALTSENAEMRIAACDAIGRYDDKSDFLIALQNAMTAAVSSKEIAAAKSALMQFPEPELSEVAARRVVHGDNSQRIAYLEIIAARCAEQHLKPVRKCLENEETGVRRAALNTLAAIGTQEDMATLFGRLISEEADAEATAARNAIVAVADRHNLRPDALAQLQSLFKDASLDSRVRLLKTLGALGDAGSLDEVSKIAESALFGEGRDEALGNVVLETLGTWQNVRACDLLLDFFGRMEAEEQRMAVLLQIVIAAPRVFSDAPQQVEFLEKVQALCTTEAEKQIVMGAIEKAKPVEK